MLSDKYKKLAEKVSSSGSCTPKEAADVIKDILAIQQKIGVEFEIDESYLHGVIGAKTMTGNM